MAEIFIRDYEDDFWGDLNCIGMGLNHSNVIVPKIDAAIEAKEDIIVTINSGGGSVFCGLAISNALQRAKESGLKVTTINEALCASIATVIFMQGDERISYASLFMVHKPALFIFGKMDADDMKREQAALDIVQSTILATYAPTGLDEGTLNEMLNAETWLTPAMCLALGFSTEDRSAKQENKTDVLEANLSAIKDPINKIYANKYFNSITNKNKMDVQETLKKQNEAIEKSNGLIEKFTNWFGKKFANELETEVPPVENASSDLDGGGKIYYMGVLGVGTEVFSDEAMSEHPSAGDHDLADGNFITVDDAGIVTVLEKKAVAPEDQSEVITNLQNQNAELLEAVNKLTAQIELSNSALDKIKSIKSTYEPAGREQEIDRKGKVENNGNKTMADIEARRKERENLKNNK